MSSDPSDVLVTVLLWICFCITSTVLFKTLAGDQKPPALCHHYVEPQLVFPPPLCTFDLPPPREPVEPTFEPRPEPEPLHRRYGLIPRAERLVRPAVPSERPRRRERRLAEMSTREKVASAEREAARESYEAQKEQERHWRNKAIASAEAEAERGHSERKQLNINSGAANNYPRKLHDMQIEKPSQEGSNALTGTALGDRIKTAYAPPMDVEEVGATARPEIQFDNPLLRVSDEDAAEGLRSEVEMLQQVKADGGVDDAWRHKVLWVYMSWNEWITRGKTLPWDFDKLNEAQIRYLVPVVEHMFTYLDNRCGKRKEGLPPDSLDDTLAIVSLVRDSMNEALEPPKESNSGQSGTQDEPSQTHKQSSHEQEQIAEGRKSAERLDQQLNQKSAQIASDHEYAQRLAQQEQQKQQQPQQRQHQKGTAPAYQQTYYMQDDYDDEQYDPYRQHYPQTTESSGSGTYPKEEWARPRVDLPMPDTPIPEPEFKLPRYKVVRLASERFDFVIWGTGSVLAGGAQDSNDTFAGDATVVVEEQVNTDQADTPTNPLLELQPAEAWETLASWLNNAESVFETLTVDETESWFQELNDVFTCWCDWMVHCDGDIWRHIEGHRVVQLANVAFGAHDLIKGQLGVVTDETVMVCERMLEAKLLAEMEEQARINEEQRQESIRTARLQHQEQQQEQARINEEQWQESIRNAQILQQQQQQQQEQARINEEARQESIRMAQLQQQEQARLNEEARQESIRSAQMLQQQQQQQQEQARIHEEQRQEYIRSAQILWQQQQQEQARINEELRQQSMAMAHTQSQQRPRTPAPVEDEEDLYGLSPGGRKSKSARAKAESNAPSAKGLNASKHAIVAATDDELEASIRAALAGEDTLPDSGAQQQQHVGAPFQPHQQAPPAPLANVDAVPATERTTQVESQNNSANEVAPETKQASQDEMDTTETEPGSPKVRLDVQKTNPQTNQFSFATNEIEKKHQDAFNKNLKAANAARKTAVERAAFKNGWRLNSGEQEALFLPDDVQKKHQDELRKDRAKAEADIAASQKVDNESPPVARGTTNTDTISQPSTAAQPRSGTQSTLTSFKSSSDENGTQPRPSTGPPQTSSSNTVLNFSTGPPRVQQKPAPGSDEDNAQYRKDQAAKCFPPKLNF